MNLYGPSVTTVCCRSVCNLTKVEKNLLEAIDHVNSRDPRKINTKPAMFIKTAMSPVQWNLRSRPEKTYIKIVGNMIIEVRILSHFFTFSFFLPRSSINSAGNKIELTIRRKIPRSNTYQAHFQESVPAATNRIVPCKTKIEKTWIKRRMIFLFTVFYFHRYLE